MRSLLVCIALACGCGPKLIWTGRTADRVHRVEVMRDNGLDFVVVDGQRRAAYRGIAGWSIALAGEHIAFGARIGNAWVVVHDGRIGAHRWDGIGEIRLTADNRLVYIAQRAGGWHVVAGNAIGPRVDAVLAGTLNLAGSHVAYAAQLGTRTHVIVDGKRGDGFDGVGQLVLRADGRHAYAGRKGLSAYAVVDGKQSPAWDGIAQLQLGPRARSAYVVSTEGGVRLVVDDDPGPLVDLVRDIRFRDDGVHVAALVGSGGADILMLDGNVIAAWPKRRDPKLAFRPSAAGGEGSGLAYVMTSDDGDRVIVDGRAGSLYDEARTPVWSSDGRLAYAARRGTRWVIVAIGVAIGVDGAREHDGGDAVGDPVLAGARLAFAGRRGKRGFVSVDGKTYDYDLVFEDTVAFSADGARWGAVAGDRTREQLFIVIDGARRVPVAVRELYSAVASGGDDSMLRTWTRAELERPRATQAARR